MKEIFVPLLLARPESLSLLARRIMPSYYGTLEVRNRCASIITRRFVRLRSVMMRDYLPLGVDATQKGWKVSLPSGTLLGVRRYYISTRRISSRQLRSVQMISFSPLEVQTKWREFGIWRRT